MALSSSDRNPVEELAEEFVARFRRGERPSLNEYIERFPQWAEKIRTLFPAMLALEKARPVPADVTGPFGGPGPVDNRPQQLGEFRILREVGRGGMGVVYEAEQESLGRRVALKVLAAHAVLDARHLQRFQREARAAARLHHTNIVPVHGVGEQEGLHYYVMQFIQGLGLDEVLAELKRLRQAKSTSAPADGRKLAVAVAESLLSGRFAVREPEALARDGRPAPPSAEPHAHAMPTGDPTTPSSAQGETAVNDASTSASVHLPGQAAGSSLSESGWEYWRSVARIGIQVAEALAYASSQGILHRDIKPSNLLLDTHGTVWVTDFGLAKTAADEANLTRTGDVVGTLRYMAPERFQGKADVRSDLYALGLTLYELLTQRPAFVADERSQLIAQVLREEPPRPRQLDRSIPRDLETIVLKATAREPAHRYQTPAEMADDLTRFLDDQPIKARRLGLAQRSWRWCRRNPAPAALVAVSVVGFVVVAWLGWRADVRRAEADLQRERAQKHYDRAFAVVERLTLVGERELADVPFMDETRRRILEDALAFYRSLLNDDLRDVAARTETGRAHARIARIHHLLGGLDQAEAAWLLAIGLQRGLAEEFPHESLVQLDLSKSRRSLAMLQHLTGRTPDAERALRELLADDTRLARASPALAAYSAELVEDHYQLGLVCRLTRRPDEAEESFGKALRLAEALARAEPAEPGHRETQARCLNLIGLLCRESAGRLAEAQGHLVNAREILGQLVTDHPKKPAYQETLASVFTNLGTVQAARGHRSDAEKSYQLALDIDAELARIHPELPHHQMNLAKAFNNLGLFHARAKDWTRVEAANASALKIHEELKNRYPTRLECAVQFAGTCGNQAKYLKDQGMVKKSLVWYEKAIEAARGVLAVEDRHTQARQVLHNAHHGRAGAYQILEQPSDAARDWRRMVELGEGERHDDYVRYRPRALAHLGEHARATAEAEKVLAAGAPPDWLWQEFAGIFSLCFAAAQNDTALAQPERDALAERYAVRAVALLAKAGEIHVFQTPAQVAALRTSQKLQPLRKRDDFLRLVTELEEQVKAGPKD